MFLIGATGLSPQSLVLLTFGWLADVVGTVTKLLEQKWEGHAGWRNWYLKRTWVIGMVEITNIKCAEVWKTNCIVGCVLGFLCQRPQRGRDLEPDISLNHGCSELKHTGLHEQGLESEAAEWAPCHPGLRPTTPGAPWSSLDFTWHGGQETPDS